MQRYRISLEEEGNDDPGGSYGYVIALYIEADDWEDRLSFGLCDAGVKELIREIEEQES